MILLRRSLCLGFSVLMMGMASAALVRAEKPPQDLTNWENLKALAPDQQVRVYLKDGRLFEGNVQLLTADSIVVRLGRTDETFKRESVLRTLAKGESHRSRNALIGTVVGGGLPGGVAGALIPTGRYREIYRATDAGGPPSATAKPEGESK